MRNTLALKFPNGFRVNVGSRAFREGRLCARTDKGANPYSSLTQYAESTDWIFGFMSQSKTMFGRAAAPQVNLRDGVAA